MAGILLFVLGLAHAEPLTVATVERRPFVMQSDEGLTGFSVDLWRAVTSELGEETTFVACDTFGEMLESPLIHGFAANRAGARHRGSYMAVLNMAFAVAAIAAPVGGARLYDESGPAVMWAVAGAAGVVAAGTAWIVSKRIARGDRS